MKFTEQEMDTLAHGAALNKPNVLTGRQLLLVELIEKRLKEYYGDDGPGKNSGVVSLDLVIEQGMRYLRQGYLYFADLGISTESQFRFLELKYISDDLKAELEKAPEMYEKAIHDGEPRQGHYQREVFNGFLREAAKERHANEVIP